MAIMENLLPVFFVCHLSTYLVSIQPTNGVKNEQDPSGQVHVLPSQPFVLHVLPVPDLCRASKSNS